MNNDGILRGNNVIKFVPDKSVVKLNIGDRIKLTAVRVTPALRLKEAVGAQLSHVVADLGEGIRVRCEGERLEHRGADVGGAPAGELGSAMEEHLHQAEHARVMYLDARHLGAPGGGWMSSRLMKQGWTLDRARKVVMLISAVSMAASLPAIVAPTPLGFVLFLSLATFGHGSWATTTQTIPGDIVAPRFVGTVYGITAFGGGIGAIIFTYVTGKLVDTYGSFTGPFVIAAVLPLVAYAAFAWVAGQIRPVQFEAAAAAHGSRS